eukprot:CAMPEP_0173406282 /NCGR_PEP_ID=MMETSP1356-20130122/64254_1 /TAXON_ID=77927 ORGANISM="Hemiselmis virescens, Strain PCC157" /NCGR_SAMPLE_ID=MMETSP1356 /ASSEMBLY_ACC=CAM_ASM_000847 /LENGTH=100 /DNA_ID=CAMNT_0014367251 /DNA_START=1 /DNA_END=303 /DNA_ORIENTATION=+
MHLGGGMRIENFDEISVILFAVAMGSISLIFSIAALVIALVSLNKATHPAHFDAQLTRPSTPSKKAMISPEKRQEARDSLQRHGSSGKRVLQPVPVKAPA